MHSSTVALFNLPLQNRVVSLLLDVCSQRIASSFLKLRLIGQSFHFSPEVYLKESNLMIRVIRVFMEDEGKEASWRRRKKMLLLQFSLLLPEGASPHYGDVCRP